MSYREGQFHIRAPNPHPPHNLDPPTPCNPIPTHPLDPHLPLAKFCVQFWSLFHEQDHLVSLNSIRETIKRYS